MHNPSVKHTLAIFEQMYNRLPPLVPEDVQVDMAEILEQFRDNYDLTLNELEDIMAKFGKKTWPYRTAFYELVKHYKDKMGEIFLHQRLSRKLKKRYKEFLVEDGSFDKLLAGGGVIDFFKPEERVELSVALVETHNELRSHVAQLVMSADRDVYEDRIDELQDVLKNVEKKLKKMKKNIDDEGENQELADEIYEEIRSFEHGLSLLGPCVGCEAVENLEDYFLGRRDEKKMFGATRV